MKIVASDRVVSVDSSYYDSQGNFIGQPSNEVPVEVWSKIFTELSYSKSEKKEVIESDNEENKGTIKIELYKDGLCLLDFLQLRTLNRHICLSVEKFLTDFNLTDQRLNESKWRKDCNYFCAYYFKDKKVSAVVPLLEEMVSEQSFFRKLFLSNKIIDYYACFSMDFLEKTALYPSSDDVFVSREVENQRYIFLQTADEERFTNQLNDKNSSLCGELFSNSVLDVNIFCQNVLLHKTLEDKAEQTWRKKFRSEKVPWSTYSFFNTNKGFVRVPDLILSSKDIFDDVPGGDKIARNFYVFIYKDDLEGDKYDTTMLDLHSMEYKSISLYIGLTRTCGEKEKAFLLHKDQLRKILKSVQEKVFKSYDKPFTPIFKMHLVDCLIERENDHPDFQNQFLENKTRFLLLRNTIMSLAHELNIVVTTVLCENNGNFFEREERCIGMFFEHIKKEQSLTPRMFDLLSIIETYCGTETFCRRYKNMVEPLRSMIYSRYRDYIMRCKEISFKERCIALTKMFFKYAWTKPVFYRIDQDSLYVCLDFFRTINECNTMEALGNIVLKQKLQELFQQQDEGFKCKRLHALQSFFECFIKLLEPVFMNKKL